MQSLKKSEHAAPDPHLSRNAGNPDAFQIRLSMAAAGDKRGAVLMAQILLNEDGQVISTHYEPTRGARREQMLSALQRSGLEPAREVLK